MQSESSNTQQNESRLESVDIKTDYGDETPNNISVLNEVPSISQLSLQPADSICSQYQHVQIEAPPLLDNNYTPRSTLSDIPNIPSMSPFPIISSNQHNYNNKYLYQQHHYMQYNNAYNNHYMPYNNQNNHNYHNNAYTKTAMSHLQPHYSTNQISCPGKYKCPDKDCCYGHASQFTQNGRQLFCEQMDINANCRHGHNCRRNHRISWNVQQPPKELRCPYYYNRKHLGYCKAYNASKCPYYHGRVDAMLTHNYESKNQSQLSELTGDYVLYSHGYCCIKRERYGTVEQVDCKTKRMNKSHVVVHARKIIREYKLGFFKLQWFYMCIGEAVFDGFLEIPAINHYCIVWHNNNQCWSLPFDVNASEFKKCKQRYNELKGYARAIIYNGTRIKQTIDRNGKNIDNGVNEWLKSAVGLYYYQFSSN